MRRLLPAALALTLGCASAPEPVRVNTIGMKLVLIPSGEFLMGTSAPEAERMLDRMKKEKTSEWYLQSPTSEQPRHRVRITRPFYMAATETTLAQFRRFVEETGYRTDAERDGKGADGRSGGRWRVMPEFNWGNMGVPRAGDLPVVNVTWNDAVAFCDWLTRKEGRPYRLPTEAEWEYACRAGTTTPFFWGSDESKRDEYVWSGANSGGDAHPVGTKKPNPWGLHDICGNVYEYCLDWHTAGPYDASVVDDPQGPSTGTEKVVRSASWGTRAMHCRSSFRGGAGVTHRNRRDGFRVVAPVP